MAFSKYETNAQRHLKSAEALFQSPYEAPMDGAVNNRDLRDAHIRIAQVYATLAIMPIS
jgi:hypothetical protein